MAGTCVQQYSSLDEQLVQTTPHHSLSMAYQVMNPYQQDQKAESVVWKWEECQPAEIHRMMRAVYPCIKDTGGGLIPYVSNR